MSHQLHRFFHTCFLIAIFIAPMFFGDNSPAQAPGIDVKTAVTKVSQLKQSIVPVVSHYQLPDIKDALQAHRSRIGLDPFIIDDQICQSGQSIFDTHPDLDTLTTSDLNSFCPGCQQKAYLAIAGNYRIEGQQSWMDAEDTQQLISQNYSHVCIYAQNNKALLLLGQLTTNTNTAPSRVTASPLPIVNFSERELWQALVDYRHAHAKPDLQTVESLCRYARERVQEHIQMFASTPQIQYPNQNKYPLDAHQGFMRDGDSGYLFEATGFNVVAENLAYWPTAQYPHQVIEWGWDTSTEGHREAQLSTDYSHACISGQDGFYVAIFARN